MTSAFDELRVPVAGGSLTVHHRSGQGPTLLFLHYWGGSARTWEPVLAHLDPRTPVASYDHRGWGRSNALPGPFDLAQLAKDAIAVVNALDTAVVLVGHSMGGKVAQLVAAENLTAVTGLVLVAPAPPEPPPTITPQFQRQLAHAYDNPETVASAVDHVLTAHALTAALRAAVIEDSLAGTAAARTEWPLRGIAEDITTAAGRICVDTVVIAGSKDRVEPVGVLREHLEPFVAPARTYVLVDSGHLVPLEAPRALADQLASHRVSLRPRHAAAHPRTFAPEAMKSPARTPADLKTVDAHGSYAK
ncbi:hydrolase [Mycolicibacterium canariasense]|uniref:Hydrolase n=1 Tax=Mycolicibacterium canariasense TaxID=228230 RepID=A0A117IB72_MYCCR|nr:alpha/beta hydrolase [Mycolicibacterium canariasense]MCV7210741.1 alpha/beta fold hydrolase [Mycolicibacterium canariasense]GAS97490.1 hydrolase [Mycolicibacterium canariasense]